MEQSKVKLNKTRLYLGIASVLIIIPELFISSDQLLSYLIFALICYSIIGILFYKSIKEDK